MLVSTVSLPRKSIHLTGVSYQNADLDRMIIAQVCLEKYIYYAFNSGFHFIEARDFFGGGSIKAVSI